MSLRKVINRYTNKSRFVTVEENNDNMKFFVGEIVGLYNLDFLPLDICFYIGGFLSTPCNSVSPVQQRVLDNSYNRALFAEILRNSVDLMSRSNDEIEKEENEEDFDECLWVVCKMVKDNSSGDPYLMEARNCYVCGNYNHFSSSRRIPRDPMIYVSLRAKIVCHCSK